MTPIGKLTLFELNYFYEPWSLTNKQIEIQTCKVATNLADLKDFEFVAYLKYKNLVQTSYLTTLSCVSKSTNCQQD